MGNAIACFAPKEITTTRRSQADYGSSLFSRSTSKKARKSYKEEQDAVVHEQALAAVLLLKQYHQRNNGSLTDRLPLNCSNSVVYPSPAKSGIHKQSLTRSSTARQASSSDSSATLIPRKPDQQAKQAVEIDEVETRHFVLVHGGGFGAWCWYKTMTLLSEAMFRVDAVDLTGSGVHPSDPNSVQTMEQYVKPLVDILDKLGDKEK
ncbi:hypothetical protein CRG98_026884, partial [Punica granatum]